MLNSGFFETITILTVGRPPTVICAKKKKKNIKIVRVSDIHEGLMCQKRKKLLGCWLSANKQLAGHMKTLITYIIYSKFGQLYTIF
jgi:hypothetical protein